MKPVFFILNGTLAELFYVENQQINRIFGTLTELLNYQKHF